MTSGLPARQLAVLCDGLNYREVKKMRVSEELKQRGLVLPAPPARICILNTLALVEQHIGDLDRVKNVVKLLGLVNSADGFNRQPEVINGASQLLVDLFGDRGWHARSAIGANELPGDITVEIESIFEI